ncbi:MAG: 50S ribosomal protein L21 [Deltaproteobacteria bacterium]|nr:50S ribosomal protein L21 [Deltaproteobacteria bacterium]
MYAIIETGGKQYRVTSGDVVSLESLKGDVGQTVTFEKVLLIGGKSDNQTLVGAPYVAKAALQAEIVEHTRGEKILTIKYKRRKGYRRTMGHRQELTRVLVTKIDDGHGQAITLDAAKRKEVLVKASVPFSKRQAEHEAKHASAKPASKKAAAPKAPSAKPSAAAAKAAAAPKKTTTKTKKD